MHNKAHDRAHEVIVRLPQSTRRVPPMSAAAGAPETAAFLTMSLRRLVFSDRFQIPRRHSCRRVPWRAYSGTSAVSASWKGKGNGLLKGFRDKTGDVKNILEMARRASLRQEIFHTDFLTPPVLEEATMVLEKLADVKAVAQGGYPQAERCRLSIGHPQLMDIVPDAVAAISVDGNFGFDPCGHGDFLGAILGVGISREKLGDILLQGEKGAQVITVPELVQFFVTSLDKVGNVSVSCSEMPLLALKYEPPRTKSFKTIEASLRIDAIASAGFKMSRSKLVDLISKGDVRINWTPVTKNGAMLRSGDIVSVSGKGRLKIGEINTTRKGKYVVELILYL